MWAAPRSTGLRLAALFSGGKDSTYSVYSVEREGHTVEMLLTAQPSKSDSLYFHYPNVHLTALQAESMNKRHILLEVSGDELDTLKRLIRFASGHVDGVVLGVISSRFQRKAVEEICRELGLQLVTPLWGREQSTLLREMIRSGFEIMITGVAAWGLTEEWLGKILTEAEVDRLEEVGRRFGVSLCGEGGELETFVLDCPLFSKRVQVLRSEKIWMGDRGLLKILDARLSEKA